MTNSNASSRDARGSADRTEWSTSNLDLAAFLALCGHPILRAEPAPGNPLQFLVVFPHAPALLEHLHVWESGGAGELRRYAEIHNNVFRLVKTSRQLAGGGR